MFNSVEGYFQTTWQNLGRHICHKLMDAKQYLALKQGFVSRGRFVFKWHGTSSTVENQLWSRNGFPDCGYLRFCLLAFQLELGWWWGLQMKLNNICQCLQCLF